MNALSRKRTEPAFIEPMQCKPVTTLPSDEKWTFEIKFMRAYILEYSCTSISYVDISI